MTSGGRNAKKSTNRKPKVETPAKANAQRKELNLRWTGAGQQGASQSLVAGGDSQNLSTSQILSVSALKASYHRVWGMSLCQVSLATFSRAVVKGRGAAAHTNLSFHSPPVCVLSI